VVRQIFSLYAAGDGILAIAKRLNAEGVPTPRPRGHQRHRPRSWSPSAIREMLRHDLYRGELVWNRSRWTKRRRGGRRRAERPESEWRRQQDPAWVIVPPDLWDAVHERIAERRAVRRPGNVPAGPARSNRARALLAGLLQCDVCGGAFCSISRGVATCSWRRSRGPSTCTNGLRVPYADLEARIIGAVREQVVLPGADFVVERALELLRQRRADPGLDAKRARLAELPAEIGDPQPGGPRRPAGARRPGRDRRPPRGPEAGARPAARRGSGPRGRGRRRGRAPRVLRRLPARARRRPGGRSRAGPPRAGRAPSREAAAGRPGPRTRLPRGGNGVVRTPGVRVRTPGARAW
jgi:hypothetical protein